MSTIHFLHQPDLDNFILVYTMGKVGSAAIARSLEAAGIFCRHLQWLRPETQAFIGKVGQVKPNLIFNALNRLNWARAHCALRNREYAEIIKVITAVRSPIEQILSLCFQSYELYKWQLKKSNRPVNAESFVETILEGVQYFLARPDRKLSELTDELSIGNLYLIHFCWTVHNYLTWFDQELLPFFQSPIIGGQMTGGYQLAGNVMIVKFEEFGSGGEQAIAAYAQRPEFKLLRVNVGADKAHGDLYSEVLQTIKFPRDFVDHLCDSKYVRHFYSEGERRAQKSRWIG
jgi:hypothetical protein